MNLERISQQPAFHDLIEELRLGNRAGSLGLIRSARLPVAIAMQKALNVPVVYITGRSDQAMTVLEETWFWEKRDNFFHFAEPTPLFYEKASWSHITRQDRLRTITTLAEYHFPFFERNGGSPFVIAPVRAVMSRTLPKRDFLKNSKKISVEQQISQNTLIEWWLEIGYQPSEIVVEPGQFSRRGGLLDIWPGSMASPIRLDFFGDEIDTIRSFDPGSQRTIENLSSIFITPAREFLPGYAKKANLSFSALDEFELPLIHTHAATLLDYLPENSLIIFDDLAYAETIASEIEEQAVRFREDSIQEGLLDADFPVPYKSWSEILDDMAAFRWLEMGYTHAGEENPLGKVFQPGQRFAGQLKGFVSHLKQASLKGEETYVVSRQSERLKELWKEQRPDEGDGAEVSFSQGALAEGWDMSSAEGKLLHLYTDSEIFGWERPKPRRAVKSLARSPESIYADLRLDDLVVHVDYGIGRYGGLVKRTIDGSPREFLMLLYDKGDQLFVPTHQADRVTRYIGPDHETPMLTRLGTQEWQTARQKVKEGVQIVAQELLELYAKRMQSVGFAFSADSPWQKELEASFPYTETTDQLKAIQDVKSDMENTRPMDRLLCGDVGYGKTEVALRAAFKAVMSERQVAVLVPTTVLAQQHFETFRQRLATFPISVEMLSRFRNQKEQDEIVKKLAAGQIDIIIGTHRLVQPDIQFKNLGLVVIDEEQRFGVTHKEYLKKYRAEVDVLTLTATPIPRTLYMALTGVRDISTINTPPEERLPIVTHIGPYAPKLVRQAVLRELDRGGQIFFVHNRVQTIGAMKMHLNQLVPEARVGVAHGQMHEQQLAKSMEAFTRGEIDILLCTSIIESGLDIPNANTLIVDRGDTFGLAQLYQLRGRVGRGAQRAYAYFFRHRRKAPTPEGLERLEILAENAQLGAGYSIAMRDLEMRGAGELLGNKQHGFIASVGFHLYTKLLALAVGEQRQKEGMDMPAEWESIQPQSWLGVNVDLPINIGFPEEYIPDQNLRLRLYRRLANVKTEAELQTLETEFVDRFGPLPKLVENLVFQTRVKLLSEEKGLVSVLPELDQIVLRYPLVREVENNHDSLPAIGPSARAGKNAYWVAQKKPDEQWQERLIETLRLIPDMKDVFRIQTHA